MKASDVMVSRVIKVKETDTVRAALSRFVEHRISGLPVVNERNEAVGYLSDGDIMRWIGKYDPVVFEAVFFTGIVVDPRSLDQKFLDLIDRNVMELATKHIVSVGPDEDIDKVAALLGKKRIKKVPVLRGGAVIGIISRGDIIRAVSRHYLQGE